MRPREAASRLVNVITVAQPAARPWDGQRILRFLTGLALLALAVTLRLPGPAVTVPVAAPVTPAVVAVATEVAAPDPEIYESERIAPQPVGEAAAAPETVTFATRIPRDETPGVTGPRAPPAL
jgi:hypothetical protein